MMTLLTAVESRCRAWSAWSFFFPSSTCFFPSSVRGLRPRAIRFETARLPAERWRSISGATGVRAAGVSSRARASAAGSSSIRRRTRSFMRIPYGAKRTKNGSIDTGTGVTPSLRSRVCVVKLAPRW